MIDPIENIYTIFKQTLDGIVYNGDTLDVVSFIGKGKTPFYIQLGDVTTVEEGCVDLFGHECTIDIQVICQYDGNYGSPIDASRINKLVANRLEETTVSTLPIDDFNMVYIVRENSFTDPGLFETNRSFRIINQYRFLILETGIIDPWILETGFWNDNGIYVDSATWNDGP